VTGCAAISDVTTEGNHHTFRDEMSDNLDYYFYVFIQDKESNSQLIYMLYKLESKSGLFKEVKSNESFFESPLTSVDNRASLGPLEAFQQALYKTRLSPEWKEHIDRLELSED
jgi:hypothetical protein